MKQSVLAISLLVLSAAFPAFAGEQQSHAKIHEVAEAFVREQAATLPGRVSIKVDDIDRRVVRPACRELEAFLPAGARLLGNGMVGVRCSGKKGWTLFVPVHVKVSVEMLISSHPLVQGTVLREADLSRQEGELTQVGVLTDPAQAIGKVVKYGIGAGQVLKQDMLRPPYLIKQGQVVHLKAEGAGFSVLSEGRALGNAAEGEDVQVRTESGKLVSGKARPDGVVEVHP